MKKKIVFVGAGNVATHLALQLNKNGYNIIQVYSRTVDSAQSLASQVNASFTTEVNQIADDADYYIFSLKDSVLENIIENMAHANGVWLHTSGSMPLNVFEEKIQKYGVLYPLQTFSKQKQIEWENVPLFLEASTPEVYEEISSLASVLSNKQYPLSTDKRRYVHLSGVFACNFVNYMYDLAGQIIVNDADLPFDVLLPLIEETCSKVHTLSPHEAQTGPAIRYDVNVIDKHLHLLGGSSEMADIYRLISESIHKGHK